MARYVLQRFMRHTIMQDTKDPVFLGTCDDAERLLQYAEALAKQNYDETLSKEGNDAMAEKSVYEGVVRPEGRQPGVHFRLHLGGDSYVCAEYRIVDVHRLPLIRQEGEPTVRVHVQPLEPIPLTTRDVPLTEADRDYWFCSELAAGEHYAWSICDTPVRSPSSTNSIRGRQIVSLHQSQNTATRVEYARVLCELNNTMPDVLPAARSTKWRESARTSVGRLEQKVFTVRSNLSRDIEATRIRARIIHLLNLYEDSVRPNEEN